MTHDESQYARLHAILGEAHKLHGDELDALLARECGEDDPLRARALEMIEAGRADESRDVFAEENVKSARMALETCLLLMALGAPADAFSDWPTFLGPQGNNSYAGPAITTKWGGEGPRIAWSIELEPGFGGYRAGSVMLKVLERDGEFIVTEEFRHPLGSSVHPALLWGEHLYVVVNENFNESRRRWDEGGLMCLDLEGNERWRTGADPNFGRGPHLVSDGVLILQDGHDGVLRLVEATPDEYRPLAEAELFPEETRRSGRMWAPMALSDGRLLLRSQDVLKYVDVRRG